MADPMLVMMILLHLAASLFGLASSSDVDALLRFRSSITSDPGELLRASWDGNRIDQQTGCPLQWHGVTCGSSGNVTGLLLGDLGLVGVIPPDSIGRLSSLSSLVLSNNSLHGVLPSDLGSLGELTLLDLSNNNFTGGLPASLVGLRSVRNFSLAGNQLYGSVPDDAFSGMTQLLDLNLGRNVFSGALPSSLASLQQLVSLDLSCNAFSGTTSGYLSKLRALRRVDLHRNRLSGLVDPSLMSLSQLEYIDVSCNMFADRLPWQQDAPMTFPESISHVNLSFNRFSGELAPEDSTNLFASKLETLDVSSNELSGKLPGFNFAFSIRVLRLQNNSFTGFIPAGLLAENSALEELDISSNQLEGSLPNIIKASSLSVLKFSSNRLSGLLPARLGSAAEIDLSNNNFTGSISVMSGWGDGVQKLDLSGNSLTGALPNETEHLIRLIYLNISRNKLSGNVPSSYASFEKLTTLDLSFNELDGGIPGEYFHSASISTLKLSNNHLSGGIPVLSFLSSSSQLLSPSSTLSPSSPGLSLFAPLQVLDLSSNTLNGSIPREIASLAALQSLNLSRNNFTGVIPFQLSNLTYLESLDLSFNHLTGRIPEHLPASLQALNLSHNELTGVIPRDLSRFPLSSFFPGNAGLRAPPGRASGSGGLPGLFSHRRSGLSSPVKAGLIGGLVAAAAIVIATGAFIYARRRSSSSSRFEEVEQQRDVFKGPPEKEFVSPAPPPARVGSVSLSREQLLPGPSSYNESVEAERSPPTFQHSVSLKSRSPDKLAGDLSLLNTSIVFTPDELSSAPAEVLGRSSHGTSYKATLESGHVLTVKWLREGLARDKKAFTREAKKFGSIQHPNIVPLRGYYWGPKEHEKLIISDYLPAGSLADRLSERRPPALDWTHRLSIANDIAQGLLYLHTKHKLPHGNLKATNVLLDEGLVARLSDYCIHRLMTEAGTANQIVNAGALGYRAPELAHTGKPKPTLKADVYAFGVILLEILTGKGAGDIISGNSGAVDLTDWVRVVVSQGRGRDCYDQTLVVGEEQEQQIERVLELALRCISQQRSERPGIKVVSEEIAGLLRR